MGPARERERPAYSKCKSKSVTATACICIIHIHTNLVGEAAEDGAAIAAGEPEEERGVAGLGLGLGPDEVVEELDAGVLVHLHVPLNSVSSFRATAIN